MNETILVIEDDINISEGLNDIFSTKGYNVLSVDNAKLTFDIIKEHAIDLIILDVHLGEENGYDLCKKIRLLYDTPILFLTA